MLQGHQMTFKLRSNEKCGNLQNFITQTIIDANGKYNKRAINGLCSPINIISKFHDHCDLDLSQSNLRKSAKLNRLERYE
jgi:hypothetical protein